MVVVVHFKTMSFVFESKHSYINSDDFELKIIYFDKHSLLSLPYE